MEQKDLLRAGQFLTEPDKKANPIIAISTKQPFPLRNTELAELILYWKNYMDYNERIASGNLTYIIIRTIHYLGLYAKQTEGG